MMDTLTAPRLGPTRTNWQYPFKDLLDAGARMACGSDWSVSSADPFEQMAVAVERVGADDAPPFRPDQAIDVAAALHAFTMGSAFVNHDDNRAGSISPGKDADLIVASDDPLTSVNLREVTVEQTYVGGELVAG
jgi:predicted amidohydrolase YtcJ